MREGLANDIRQVKADALLTETSERLEDALAGGAKLEEAAKDLGVPFQSTEPISADGRRADHSRALDPVQYSGVIQTAFSLPEGERSPLTSEAEGRFYLVEVSAIAPPRERTFEEVRGLVIADWELSARLEEHKKKVA